MCAALRLLLELHEVETDRVPGTLTPTGPAPVPEQAGEIRPASHALGMTRAQRLLEDSQRPLVQHRRLVVFLQRLAQHRQVVERQRDVRVARAQQLFLQRQGTAVEPLGLGGIARRLVEGG